MSISEVSDALTWGRHLKVPLHPETGEPNPEWEQVNDTKLTEEQLERITKAYAADNQYFYNNYADWSEKERKRWRYQRYIKDYLRVVREVDDEVGRLMAYLERDNLMNNTIVIYAGDQGFFLGEKGWFDKRWIYEESMRMPLIVYWPAGIASGSMNTQLVQNLDFAPTILELAGAEIPDRLQGRSMVPLLRGKNRQDWRDAVYYHYFEGLRGNHEVGRHYGVRTDQYTLAHFFDHDEWEMFDRGVDPEQLKSVYNEPEYAEIQQYLKNKITELQEKYGDDTWSNFIKGSDRRRRDR